MKLSGVGIWNSILILIIFIVSTDITFRNNKHIMLKSCLSFSYKTTTTRRAVQSQHFRTILEANSSKQQGDYQNRKYTRGQKALADIANIAMPKRKKGPNYYAVAVGRNTGIFSTWDECSSQVNGFKGSRFKKFSTFEEAESFVASYSNAAPAPAVETEPPRVAVTTKKKRPRAVSSKESKSGSANNPIPIEPLAAKSTSTPADADDTDKSDSDGVSSDKKEPHKLYFHVMFDGGSRGNPHGDAGSGTYILTRKFYSRDDTSTKQITRSTVHIRTYLGLGMLTNNQAEYTGLVTGLKQVSKDLAKMNSKQLKEVVVFVQGDSDLIVKQMNGIYACKSPKLKSYHLDARGLVGAIQKRCKSMGANCKVTFEHVYREDNKIADALANEAMDAKRSWVTTKGDDEDGDIEV